MEKLKKLLPVGDMMGEAFPILQKYLKILAMKVLKGEAVDGEQLLEATREVVQETEKEKMDHLIKLFNASKAESSGAPGPAAPSERKVMPTAQNMQQVAALEGLARKFETEQSKKICKGLKAQAKMAQAMWEQTCLKYDPYQRHEGRSEDVLVYRRLKNVLAIPI